MVQGKLGRTATDGDPVRDWGVTGEVWNVSVVGGREPRMLPIRMSLLSHGPPLTRFPITVPTGPLPSFVPRVPAWVSLIVSWGALVPSLEFVSSPRTPQLHPPQSGLVLSIAWTVETVLQPRLRAAYGIWMVISGWAWTHRSWHIPHLPTTISWIKSPFSFYHLAEKKLLFVWDPLLELESSQFGYKVVGVVVLRKEIRAEVGCSSLSPLT